MIYDLFTVDCDRVTSGHDLRIRRRHTIINARLLHFSQRVIKHSSQRTSSFKIYISAFKRNMESVRITLDGFV